VRSFIKKVIGKLLRVADKYVRLLLLRFQYYKLLLYKKRKGISLPIVHYYALCWNEERLLPFMFRHYGSFVDSFFIYDNYSDDRSEEIIRQQPNATIIKFDTNGEISDETYLQIKNNCWKQSRGKADYVIVGDIDEFLYSKDMSATILDFARRGVTIVKPVGCNMYSEAFPEFTEGRSICEMITRGVKSAEFNKCMMFDPHKIVEINYSPGAHNCSPRGILRYSEGDVKLLHYKFLGIDYVIERRLVYQKRLSARNIEMQWGLRYLQDIEDVKADFHQGLEMAEQVVDASKY